MTFRKSLLQFKANQLSMIQLQVKNDSPQKQEEPLKNSETEAKCQLEIICTAKAEAFNN